MYTGAWRGISLHPRLKGNASHIGNGRYAHPEADKTVFGSGKLRKSILALAVAVSLLQWSVIPAALAETLAANQLPIGQVIPSVTAQPDPGPDIRRYFIDPARERQLSKSAITQLLREKIKYVFIIFNENNSFDHEYGTFPGVNGIYSDGQQPRSPSNTPGFTQTYYDGTTNANVTVQPFRVGPEYNSSVMDSAQHDHAACRTKDRRRSGDRRGADGQVRLCRVQHTTHRLLHLPPR